MWMHTIILPQHDSLQCTDEESHEGSLSLCWVQLEHVATAITGIYSTVKWKYVNMVIKITRINQSRGWTYVHFKSVPKAQHAVYTTDSITEQIEFKLCGLHLSSL